MIERETLKKRITIFSEAMDECSPERLKLDWKRALLEGKFLFGKLKEQKMDFRNIDFTGPEIDNQEWRAQLNRFLWLETCMIEDQNDDSDYFAGIARDTILSFYDFREGVEIPDKEFLWKELGDNTLSISVRLGFGFGRGWWGTVPFMRKSIITDEFLEKMYESTAIQVDFMTEHMTSCGNWRINQLYCLLFLGYIFENDEWLKIGAIGLNESFHTQVHSDGSHEEHTVSYHKWMNTEYTRMFFLSKALPETGLQIDAERLIKMWEYTLGTTCPDDLPVGLNDDVRWGYENMDNYPVFQEFARRMRRKLIEGYTGRDYKDFEYTSRYYENAGQWYLRNEYKDEPAMLVFDATRYGGGHCHKAHNSISYYYGNKMLLTDPGTFNYERKDPFCLYGRKSISHNTISVDGLSQIESAENEAVCDIGGQCKFVMNVYSSGYEEDDEGVTGIHERLVLWYRNDICIVNDSVLGSGKRFTANFNFLPGNFSFSNGEYHTGHDDYNLMLKPVYSNVELESMVYQGSLEPKAGWLAKDGHKLAGAEEGISLHVSGDISKERGSVVTYVLVPYKNDEKPNTYMINPERLKKEEVQDIKSRIYNKASWYQIVSGDRSYEIVSAYLKYRHSRLHPSISRTGPFYSDGKLAFIEKAEGKPVFAYLYDGTYLSYNGKMLIEEKTFGNYEKTL